jgi:hypothetical protein
LSTQTPPEHTQPTEGALPEQAALVALPAAVDVDEVGATGGTAVLDESVPELFAGTTQMPFWHTRLELGCAETHPALRPGPPPPGASVPFLPAAQTSF